MMRWSSMRGLVAGGSATLHMSTKRIAPPTPAMRIPIPRINAVPMPANPIMNSQSAHH